MAVRGFKNRCENISLQMRRELGLRKSDPLSSKDLARHLDVLLWKPSDIIGLLKENRALLLGRGKGSWSAVTISCDGVHAIIYNSSHTRARQSSDIMHELSHIILRHEPSQIVVSPQSTFALRSYNNVLEEEATWLANCLLLPREALIHIRKTRITNDEACEVYEVSKQLLTYRINITAVNQQFPIA